MKSRKEIMLLLMELDSFSKDCFDEVYKGNMERYPELTKSWLERKFDRFYLVESTSHIEEKFTVQIELRYKLRSKESSRFGKTHQIFYDKYLSTIPVDIKRIEDPQSYKDDFIEWRDEKLKAAL